jgi:predicted component of type VI protein secretion system
VYELVLELVGRGIRWEFPGHEIRIGRDPNCDLVLPTDEYPMVSRSHLLIRQAAERYWVEDLNTPGGTFLNGGQIQVSPLLDGDMLRLGAQGPELRASIVSSYRLESAQALPRRPSTSSEAPTGLKKGAAVISSQEAPTGGKVASGSKVASEPNGSPDPEISPRKEPTPWPNPPASLSEAPEAPIVRGGDYVPPMPTRATPPASSGNPRLTPQDMALNLTLVEKKLKAIRNLTVAAILLTLIFGFLLIYHLWK